MRVFFALLALLLGAYLGNGLVEGDIEYGSSKGRMSRNSNVTHLTSPLELAAGTLHLGTLLVALLGLAFAPAFILRKRVVIATALVFVAATAWVLVITRT